MVLVDKDTAHRTQCDAFATNPILCRVVGTTQQQHLIYLSQRRSSHSVLHEFWAVHELLLQLLLMHLPCIG